MAKIATFLLVGIGLGFAIAMVSRPAAEVGISAAPTDSAALSRRLSALETELASGRAERQALAGEIARLREAVSAEAPVAGRSATENRPAPARTDRGTDTRSLVMAEQSSPEREERLRERQVDRFVAAGLAPDRAEWILQREQELTMDLLQARYEATRDGASNEELARISESQILREELGDADYEKYLQGRGRPTTINVLNVLENSPAAAAGLKPGDEIVSYNGKRVFDMPELTSLTYDVAPGQAVPIDVVRDGRTLQVFVPSGPIGFSGGGRSTRRGSGLRD